MGGNGGYGEVRGRGFGGGHPSTHRLPEVICDYARLLHPMGQNRGGRWREGIGVAGCGRYIKQSIDSSAVEIPGLDVLMANVL